MTTRAHRKPVPVTPELREHAAAVHRAAIVIDGMCTDHKPAGEAMASYLRAVGLKVNERAVDFPQWAREFDASPRQTTAIFTVGFLFSQDGYLSMLSFAEGRRFRTSVMPKAFDAAIDQAGKATDDAARTKLVQDAMVALNREPFAVYLYSIDDLYGVQAWVQGFAPRPDQTIRVGNMGVTPK